jgi:hypothetical protein
MFKELLTKRTAICLVLIALVWTAVILAGDAGKYAVYLVGSFAIGWHMGTIADWLMAKLGIND